MNGLIHTDLPVSQKVDLAILALAGQGQYGAMTQLAREFGISRPTVYSAAETGLDQGLIKVPTAGPRGSSPAPVCAAGAVGSRELGAFS